MPRFDSQSQSSEKLTFPSLPCFNSGRRMHSEDEKDNKASQREDTNADNALGPTKHICALLCLK